MAILQVAVLIVMVMVPVVIGAVSAGMFDRRGYRRQVSLWLMGLPWFLLLWLGLVIVLATHLSFSDWLVIVCLCCGFIGSVLASCLNLNRWHWAHQISGWLSMMVWPLPMTLVVTVFLHAAGSRMTSAGPVIVVLGFVILAVAALCTLLSIRARRRHYHPLDRQSLCIACQYDLQGNPEAEYCPECGEKVFRPLASAS